MIPWMSADKMLALTCAGTFSRSADEGVDVRVEWLLERPPDPPAGRSRSVLLGRNRVFEPAS